MSSQIQTVKEKLNVAITQLCETSTICSGILTRMHSCAREEIGTREAHYAIWLIAQTSLKP